jgi:hypothetical protein
MNSLHMPLFGLEVTIRWLARLLAVFIIGVVLLIFIGERGPNPLKLSTLEAVQMVFFITTCIGMAVGWRWEFIGGIVATVGIVLFYATELAVTGRFPHGLFPLMLFPGMLFLVSGLLRRRRFQALVS